MKRKVITMKIKILLFCLVCSLFVCFLNLPAGAVEFRVKGVEHDPDWLVDREIAQDIQGWNQGKLSCKPPRGGYNQITENQTILASWGYKARPFEEIKDLMPPPHYEVYTHPEIWGTFRINETAWEPIKPRGHYWEEFLAQTERNKKEVSLDEEGWLINYRYGIPFPVIDAKNDPRIAEKLIWNYYKRFQDNDRYVPMSLSTKDRREHSRHNLILSKRLQMSGRLRKNENTDNGLFTPNPSRTDFLYNVSYIAPYNLRGTITLYYRYNYNRDDDLWIYIPSIRRVRRMSTAQHQDRYPGGLDFTFDNTEGFEGNVTRFNWTYLGRKELLIPIIGHSHCYHTLKGYLNGNDQYYQRRNTYVIKAQYKKPVNMTEMVLYLDPILYAACYSIDRDIKGRDWIIQLITQGRCKEWFYTMYNDYAVDVIRRHSTWVQFAYSGCKDFVFEDLTMTNLKKEMQSR